MTGQASLFDFAEGQRRRDDGADVALNSERMTNWRGAAKVALLAYADTGKEFSADDITREVGMPPGGNHNAVGGLFLWAKNSGFIHAVGYTQGERASAHARVQRTWRGTRGVVMR